MPLYHAALCRELVAWATMAWGRFRRAHQPFARPLFEFLVYLPPAQRVKKTRLASERSIFRLMRGPSRIAPSRLSFAWHGYSDRDSARYIHLHSALRCASSITVSRYCCCRANSLLPSSCSSSSRCPSLALSRPVAFFSRHAVLSSRSITAKPASSSMLSLKPGGTNCV